METFKDLEKYNRYNKRIKEEKEQNFKTYIFHSERWGVYKIGKSSCPELRLKNIKQCVSDINVVMVLDVDIEVMLHRIFKHKQKLFRNQREWFLLTKQDIVLLNTIKTLLQQ